MYKLFPKDCKPDIIEKRRKKNTHITARNAGRYSKSFYWKQIPELKAQYLQVAYCL